MTAKIETLNALQKCPHCRVASPFMIKVWGGKTSGSIFSADRVWHAYVCNSCGSVVTAYSESMHDHAVQNYPDETFPSLPEAHEDLPPMARKYLQQAMDTLTSPDAAAVMAGSAVNAMLKAKGLEKGSLYSRIDEAVTNGLLTKDMGDWAHEVRLGSNRPRHADVDDPHVTLEEAKSSVDFAESLGNFLFVLTARIQRGISAAQKSSAQ